jgi:hypothetical protein
MVRGFSQPLPPTSAMFFMPKAAVPSEKCALLSSPELKETFT